ncbi:hypothetical protein J1781_00580 [Rahnella sp. C60]|uniref:hypothetical protein n=1 Tax=Rahnella perminowiae TaxID=2816244 RepID=UPI00300F2A32|nr:hypothetical protein [Rahnella perminowiae]MBU9813372.1 hypothetical protein [Rahnella perminowiae]
MPKLLPDFISQQQIIDAIQQYNCGTSHKFDASHIYDVMYPPNNVSSVSVM